MIKIVTDCKTGFYNISGKEFTIYDGRGVYFYSNKNLDKKNTEFNLPKGVYTTDTELVRLKKPIKQPVIKLQKPDRNIKINENDFNIVFGKNDCKASVFYATKKILLDNSYKTSTLPELKFLLYHEFGHLKYSDEIQCDLYATKRMLFEGFNLSQCGYASVKLLSNKQNERKMVLIKQLKNGR